MDSQRNLLIIFFLFVSFITWQLWSQNESFQHKQTTQKLTTVYSSDTNNYNMLINNPGKNIIVKTDVLELNINARGGDLEQAFLLNYSKDLKSKEPFQLLETNSEFVYQAQSGLIGRDGPDNPLNGPRPLYNVDKDIFILSNNQSELIVPMSYKDISGSTFTKIFKLKRGEYSVNVIYNIQNVSKKPLKLFTFNQLKQSVNLPSNRNTENNSFALHTFRGAAYSTKYKKYEKYKLDTIANNKNLNISSEGGWIAMLQQYFATAWVPCNNGINNFYTANLGNGIVAIGYKSRPITIEPGQTSKLQNILWVGPEIQDQMAAVASYLDLTVDYGWLWFISQPLFKMLKFINKFLGNWGSSIIIITFIMRSITYPLTKAQYTSMAKIRILQPKIQAIHERLGDDKQRISQEIIALYKSKRVNPLGGCFPLLIQMPIFLALYYMLIGSVELRQAPFILWIHDLSSKDPYYILPIIMGITMYFIQKISSFATKDPIQQKIMTFMPIIFTLFFLWFPSGLVLYYIISNLVTIIQQQIIYRNLEKRGLYNRKKGTGKLS